MTPLITPSLDKFLELAKQGNVIPVFAEFVGDCETPVSAFKKFSHCAYSFLFESTEKNDASGRFSFVGFEPRIIIQSFGRDIRIVRDGIEERFSATSDPLEELRKLMARHQFRSEEHTSELQSRGHLVCCLLLETKKNYNNRTL